MRSLRTRLLLTVLGAISAGFLLAGLIGGRVVANAIDREFDARLSQIAEALASTADITSDGNLELGEVPNAAEFNQQNSGWYWMIARGERALARSRSLWTQQLDFSPGGGRSQTITGPNEQRLRAVVRTANLGRQPVTIAVAAPARLAEQEVHTAVGSLVALLALFGLGSVIIVAFLLNRGLAPLQDVAAAVRKVSRGEVEQIEPTGYREIDVLVGAVNGLIANVRDVVARSRLHSANLAHALKTPLALIAARVSAITPEDKAINDGVDLLGRHIDHHLKRARFAPAKPVLASAIAVKPVMEDIVLVMERTFHQRGLTMEMHVADGTTFLGEREDLEELAGNLVENACKWARERVVVEGTAAGTEVVLTISDDGPGLDGSAREGVLRPGVRLDETAPGSGLGLSIAAELVERYRGRLVFDRSSWGGLKVSVHLPGRATLTQAPCPQD